MLVPIGHDQGIRRMPYVTFAIIAICTLVQLYATFVAPGVDEVIAKPELIDHIPIVRWGYHTGSGADPNLVLAAFVHDGWLHLIGNMLFLFLAGSAVEDRYGHVVYAVFYLGGAVVSTYVFSLLHGGDTILVGASGAVSALMGAFLVHFSRSQIRFWYFWLMRTGTFESPAWLALPLWLADQLLWAYLTEAHGFVTGVAYGAHLGGFGFGVIAALVHRQVRPNATDEDEAPASLPTAVARPARGTAPPAAPVDRVQQLTDAIAARDLATVRTLASRTILDLARSGDHARVVELSKAMFSTFDRVPFTDGAYVAAATSADGLGDTATFLRLADAAIAEHPGSGQIPKVMWRLAELRRDAGEVDAAIELLRTLAVRFPRDTFGERAKQALDGRGLG